MLSLEPQLINGYTEAILTPNVVEFARLYSAVVTLFLLELARRNRKFILYLYLVSHSMMWSCWFRYMNGIRPITHKETRW